MLRKLLFVALATASCEAFAASPNYYHALFSLGPSAPRASKDTQVLENGGYDILRDPGGEIVNLKFETNGHPLKHTLAGVRLTGYSHSGRGSVKVHNVATGPRNLATELIKLRGKLANRKSVQVIFKKPISVHELDFQVEAFGHDDASIVLELLFMKFPKGGWRATTTYANPPRGSSDDEDEGGGGWGPTAPEPTPSPTPGTWTNPNPRIPEVTACSGGICWRDDGSVIDCPMNNCR